MSGIHAETEVGVAQRLLLQAQTALGSYADPAWAAENGWPAFADRTAGPGPRVGARLGSSAGVRQRAVHLGAVAATTSRCSRRCWTTNPPQVNLAGLVIDTDLRWRIVTALAAGGDLDADGTGDPFIDAEAPARPDRGRQAQRRRGVRRPTAGRRQGSGLAAGDRGRHAGQHHRPGDHRRLRPARAGRAAGAVHATATSRRSPGVWERRSSEVAQTVVVGLYPSWDISQAGARRRRRLPRRPDVPPALRRLVLEGRAGVERSLRARAFDAA